jgi:hypothetical protein
MSLSIDSWNEILTALTYKADEAGIRPSQLAERLEMLREHWEFFKSKESVVAYIAAKELEAVTAQRAAMLEQMDVLNARIKELEDG